MIFVSLATRLALAAALLGHLLGDVSPQVSEDRHLFAGDGATPWHCVGGNQNLTEAIADAIGRENITLNAQVTNVIDTEEGVEVRAVDTSDFKNHTFKAKYCVLTMPLYRLFEVQFEPRLSDDVYEAVHSQGWGAYFTAHCILKKEAEKFWTVDGVSILPLLQGGPLGVIYPGKAPADKDKIMVNLLVTGGAAEQYNSRMRSFDDVQKMIEKGFEPDHAIGWLLALGLRILPFDVAHAERAARLRTDLTRKKLSFADRACIATAVLENARALTTDRIWADLDLPCKVELIR